MFTISSGSFVKRTSQIGLNFEFLVMKFKLNCIDIALIAFNTPIRKISIIRPKISERPKPEFSAETGTRTEFIPVRFRFGNSYRNRNGHFTLQNTVLQRSAQSIMLMTLTGRSKKLVLVLYSTKTYYTEWFHYTAEKIFPMLIENTLQALKI